MLRGKIYEFDFDSVFVDFPDSGEAAGERRAVIVSCESLNQKFDTVIVVPTTSSRFDERSEEHQNVKLVPGKGVSGIPKKCVAQMHLPYAVNLDRLNSCGNEVGAILDPDTLDEIAFAGGWVIGFQGPKLHL